MSAPERRRGGPRRLAALDPLVVAAGGGGALVLTGVAVVVARSPVLAGIAAVAVLPQLLAVVAGILAHREPDVHVYARWAQRLLPVAVAGALLAWAGLAVVWVGAL